MLHDAQLAGCSIERTTHRPHSGSPRVGWLAGWGSRPVGSKVDNYPPQARSQVLLTSEDEDCILLYTRDSCAMLCQLVHEIVHLFPAFAFTQVRRSLYLYMQALVGTLV